MFKFIVICVVVGVLSAEAVKTARQRKRYAGSYAGSSAGGYASSGTGGYVGGGIGSYAGYGDYGTGGYVGTGYGTGGYGGGGYAGYGYAPDFGAGFIDPYDFHQRLTAQILAQHAAQNSALASTYADGDASVSADASFYPNDIQIQQQLAHQAALFDGVRRQPSKNNRYAPSFASASGSIGNGGYYQSAHINPANPGIPNVSNRFSTSSGPGGYKGVAVSSFSSSSDVNGKRTSHRGAQTTVNDNGKISSYSVHS